MWGIKSGERTHSSDELADEAVRYATTLRQTMHAIEIQTQGKYWHNRLFNEHFDCHIIFVFLRI